MSTPPLFDPAGPGRSGSALVNHHLKWLKLGGLYLDFDFSKVPRDIPEGRGWCQAAALPEELWPAHAEFAVVVHFFPDPLFRRDDRTGHVPPPPGAMQHWTERLNACADALADCGFIVEEWGVPKTPELHGGADLVVYRLPEGIEPSPRTTEDLRHAHPPRPHFKPHAAVDTWRLRCLLARADPPLAGDNASSVGRCLVREVEEFLWPPGTRECALVTWEPSPDYKRGPDQSTAPPGAYTHWIRGLTHLAETLTTAGYQVRRRKRPCHPDTDTTATFLVCRPIPEDTAPAPIPAVSRPSTRPRWKRREADHLSAPSPNTTP
ncbi:hypothetical protein ABZY36_02500 [Streptomyces sp. NPDC006627]|uniref:hypothetical protein n=1 Tax=Streptomyces sp. NPDC006627 TaxID=3154679 RepID=UPI0033B0F6FD